MAQGNHKLAKAKKSAGAQKRKAVRTVKKTKKGNTKVERNQGMMAATKAINRKNERLIAAKAMNAGTNFSLTDISEKGKNESQRQTAERDKKQNKPTKLSQRLQVRLNKLK
mmetsp:Transcript_28477/g.81903  ORF Transcript_28477/g.81903 Transcript_28477/m.81903 type:complete len:111 (+) Transcript_28477:136-468(+)